METNSDINICICTYNRVGYLKLCLEKLVPQLISSKVELTVIDNNSTDGTKSYVRDLENRNTSIQYIFEPNQGLSIARNTAWKASESEWIFYLDDDCLPSDEIIQSAINLIKTEDRVDAIGGPIDAIFEHTIPNWLPEGFGSFSMPYDSPTVIEEGYIRGGCFLIKRSVLQKLNGFDQRLGVSGGNLQYGEEIELQLRMRSADYKIAYAPSLRTGHFVRTDKLSLSWVLHSEYARRRDKMLFEPVPVLVGTAHLIKTSLGRLIWIPIHLGEVIFNRSFTLRKLLYKITQPMAYSLGEWVGAILSRVRK